MIIDLDKVKITHAQRLQDMGKMLVDEKASYPIATFSCSILADGNSRYMFHSEGHTATWQMQGLLSELLVMMARHEL